ncbi:predicted protein [Histoplasma capsulatum H143]|uniref:Uncharacterized protein n=1 Tax=Ajellomyces capsulatus (strain H143) TaxID=544712 RepID=C6H5K2_AJECH|nr:predicted protein [Histoplasma capsulatum H143]
MRRRLPTGIVGAAALHMTEGGIAVEVEGNHHDHPNSPVKEDNGGGSAAADAHEWRRAWTDRISGKESSSRSGFPTTAHSQFHRAQRMSLKRRRGREAGAFFPARAIRLLLSKTRTVYQQNQRDKPDIWTPRLRVSGGLEVDGKEEGEEI